MTSLSATAAFRQGDKDMLKPQGFRIQTASLMISTLAINVLSLALPVMTVQIYDRILPSQGSGTLPVLISGVCVAIALEAALRLARAYSLGWAGAAYEHRISCMAMQHILHSDLSKVGREGIGENLSRMMAISKLKDFYNGYSRMILLELGFVPLFLLLVVFIAGPLALVPAVVLMVFTLISLWQGQKLRSALQKRDQADDARYNFLIEALEGVHTLKSFALENIFARRYEALEEKSSICNYNVTEATARTFNAGAIFSNIMVAAVITVGAVLAMQGQITTGALIATILLAGRMMQPVQRALGLWAKYQDFCLARDKVRDVFETPLHVPVVLDEAEPEKQGALRVQKLSFRKSDDDPWVLKNINLDLNPGECILITGDHSAGKTTLLEMIAGIYPPTSGLVDIDGRNIERYTPESLTNHVGFIRSEGMIFRGTIRENMTCFGQIPEEKAREIASLLRVDRDIARLPSGFDTFLTGTTSDSIPPGLKQRIAMVRILATKPRIILFDNADRALDREGYSLVYSLLARIKGKATIILVSNDYNIRSLADRFFTLQDGSLMESVALKPIEHAFPYRELQL